MRDQGQFFDGLTSRPHKVTITVLTDGLQIKGETGESLGNWDFNGLRSESSLNPEAEASLMHGDYPDARLDITDAAVLASLREVAPDIFKQQRQGRNILHILFQVILIIGIIAAVIFIVVPKTADVIVEFVPVEWETEWGKGVRKQITGKLKVCRSTAGRLALDRMMARLAKSPMAAKSGYDFNVTVIKMKSENALATMGGEIIVFSKLLPACWPMKPHT
jgi:hypothetical protein